MIIGTLLIAAMTGIGFLMVGFSKRAWHDGKVNTWLQINYGLTPKQGLDLIAREFHTVRRLQRDGHAPEIIALSLYYGHKGPIPQHGVPAQSSQLGVGMEQ